MTVTQEPRLEARELVARLAGAERSPAGGSASAMAVVMAAAIVEKAARHARDWPAGRGAVAQARAIRRRASPLVERCAEVYAAALAALETPEDAEAMRRALAAAADVPLRIAEAGCDAALLAGDVADLGDPALRADAQAALILAEAGTRAAALLVLENLGAAPDDPRRAAARELATTAAEARARVEL